MQFPTNAYLGTGYSFLASWPHCEHKIHQSMWHSSGKFFKTLNILGNEVKHSLWWEEENAPLKLRLWHLANRKSSEWEHLRGTQDQRRVSDQWNHLLKQHQQNPHTWHMDINRIEVRKRPSALTQHWKSSHTWVLELQLQHILFQMMSFPCFSATQHAGPNPILLFLCKLP